MSMRYAHRRRQQHSAVSDAPSMHRRRARLSTRVRRSRRAASTSATSKISGGPPIANAARKPRSTTLSASGTCGAAVMTKAPASITQPASATSARGPPAGPPARDRSPSGPPPRVFAARARSAASPPGALASRAAPPTAAMVPAPLPDPSPATRPSAPLPLRDSLSTAATAPAPSRDASLPAVPAGAFAGRDGSAFAAPPPVAAPEPASAPAPFARPSSVRPGVVSGIHAAQSVGSAGIATIAAAPYGAGTSHVVSPGIASSAPPTRSASPARAVSCSATNRPRHASGVTITSPRRTYRITNARRGLLPSHSTAATAAPGGSVYAASLTAQPRAVAIAGPSSP
jgi:hypothetical protein